MKKRIINEKRIDNFFDYLHYEEKSDATIEKYIRDVRCFFTFAGELEITRELVAAWKKRLIESGYAVRSINSMLASLNSFLTFSGWTDCKVKSIRLQRQIFCAEKKELTKAEYLRLMEAAKKDPQIRMILQTICATGIRVSELCFFTVETVKEGVIVVSCKNKTRTIFVPTKLKERLLSYAEHRGIKAGVIFRNRKGNSLDRSCIWRRMKRLCSTAGVENAKTFPHNLRKLFACTFYSVEKDIAKLADLLGHSSINTTRIYIMTSGTEHRNKMEQLGLVI